jgi:hypothetical protein
LPLLALLHGDAMVAALMREVERMANDPLPQAERKKRIAELEAEISELAYVEEALVAAAIAEGEDVQRSSSAPPQAVLQVRVAESTKSSRAAYAGGVASPEAPDQSARVGRQPAVVLLSGAAGTSSRSRSLGGAAGEHGNVRIRRKETCGR